MPAFAQNWSQKQGADAEAPGDEESILKYISSTHMHTRSFLAFLIMRIKSTGNEVGSHQTLKRQLTATVLRDFIDSSLGYMSMEGLIVGYAGLILSTSS